MSESPVRNCASCACSYVITPESVSITGGSPPATAKPQRVCRLNPPETVTFDRIDVIPGRGGRPSQEVRTPVQGIVQQATTDDTVCWQWQPPGTPPGLPLTWESYKTLCERAGIAADNECSTD